jgi:hypothetical protein
MTDCNWLIVLSGLLTPVVALLGLYIALRQWLTARSKLKLDLFDRRLLIYDAVRSYIAAVMTSGKTTQDIELAFLSGTRGARWLFGNEIVHYIDKTLWPKICQLGCLQSELDGMERGEERTRKINAQADLKIWLSDQLKVIDDIFARYITLRH